MHWLFASIIVLASSVSVFAQTELQSLLAAETAFGQMTVEKGLKAASLEFMTDDAVIFRPEPVNGKEYWAKHDDPSSVVLVRKSIYGDVSANGMLGYTAGNWRTYLKNKSEAEAEFGEYLTVWEKRSDGKFHISLDISVRHDKLPFAETERVWPTEKGRDLNTRGWSPVDASMNFLKMSMGPDRLGGAYKRFAADDVRILIENAPPILGKKEVVSETRIYRSVEFPKNVALFQSADLAYTWNPCQYANSVEGMEKGNCLHIWKLRKKKWWIIVGVYARVKSERVPTLKVKRKSGATK
jgi:ketosteroid isomerase-like protein